MLKDRKRVLLVDDDPHIVRGTCMRLDAAGYSTATARDGVDALDHVAEAKPDLILMDVHMPRMDGITALRELKNSPETMHIPIVMLSASISDEQAALDEGARFFVRKPYGSQELFNAIENADT